MLWRAARGGLLSRNALCRVPSIAPTANIPRPGRSPQPRSKGAGRCPRRGSGEARSAEGASGEQHRAPGGHRPTGPSTPLPRVALGAAPPKRTNKHAARGAVALPDRRASGWVCLSLRSRAPGFHRGLFSSSLFLAAQRALLPIFSPREISKTNPRPAPESS